MLFKASEKKTTGWNNIGGTIPLGWWRGEMVVRRFARYARQDRLEMLKDPVMIGLDGGSKRKRSGSSYV